MAAEAACLPVVYSCSGCSSAAQAANAVALRLDRAKIAEMSCIAGVGGDVPSLLRLAKSGRALIALDGCPLNCVARCLSRHGIVPSVHLTLTRLGVRKKTGVDPSPQETEKAFQGVKAALAGKTSAQSDAARETKFSPETFCPPA